METASRSPKILPISAIFGQFLALFPLAVAFCGIGLNRYVPWVYFVVFAVWAVFYAAGSFCGRLAHELELSGKPSRKAQPVVLFLSRAAVLVPTAAFIAVVLKTGITSTAFFYILPGGLIAFFGAHGSVGKGYSDIFSRGWFALYFAAGLIAAAMLWSTHEEELAADGIFQICAGFALIILLSALLANQTNIDVCTKQRAGGKSVLPSGLRRYNAVLITVICSATIGLFLFARPIAELIKLLFSLIIRGFLFVMESLSSCVHITPDDALPDNSGSISEIVKPEQPSALANIIYVLQGIVLIVVLFLLRKHIWSFIKSLIEPLFRAKKPPSDIPFYDEILVSDARKINPRARRRAERELARQYRRESDPARKYRFGYALFLIRLGKTNQPPLPVDTTTDHREKGELAFERDLGELSGVYNRVRYGNAAPTVEELARQERLLVEIK